MKTRSVTVGKNQKILMSAIDVGAHSARMLIAEVDVLKKNFVPVEELEMPVPLGADVFRHGCISEESIRILCGIFHNFREKMDEYGVILCRAIATSAVREAENAEIFMERIHHATGISLQIFEGADEARLDYTAVREYLPGNCGFKSKDVLIADVGTGACQLSVYSKGSLCFTETLKVGTLRALEQVPGGSLSAGAVRSIARTINGTFAEMAQISENLQAESIIALGSSARTFLLLRKTSGRTGKASAISKKEFEVIRKEIFRSDPEELAARFSIVPDMAETLWTFCLIMENLLNLTGALRIVIPTTSTKYLLLQDFIREHFLLENEFELQIHNLIRRIAEKYRCASEYTDRTVCFAELLFRKLQLLHGMEYKELIMLKTAAMLHKCGMFLNNQAYHKHSCYIIQNTEIPGLSRKERQITALIARYHRKAIPKMLHPEYAALSMEERSLVNKLSSLLRIACGLASLSAQPEALSVSIEPEKVSISLGAVASFPETLTEVDTSFFRDVYARKLVIS